MGELFWPGEDRAGDLFSERAFLEAMIAVESAWVDVPLAMPEDDGLDAEAGGNPVIPLVARLRAANPAVVGLHDGLTSQDVLDTALMLMLRDTVHVVRDDIARATEGIGVLDARHHHTPMIGRTLTQHALPITFGHKLDAWRAGLAAAVRELAALEFPVQVGGPVGQDHDTRLAMRLKLLDTYAWHTARRPVTRVGDVLVAVTDACGRIARDVLELSRPEIGELSEGRVGGSSSMPHKANPVLSVLIRRAALSTPQLGATLHLAAADQVDERADGAWHVEWDTLRLLARRTVVATSQTAELLADLRVHPERMADHLAAAQEAR